MLGYRTAEASTTLRSESNRKSSSDKEDKYTTRGCAAAGMVEKPKVSSLDGGGGVDEGCCKSKHVWPKLYIALTSKEKEEDFMAMKGCKLPHRPKKRAKIIQRTLLVSNILTYPSFFFIHRTHTNLTFSLCVFF